jgi:hypothetical protein
MVYFFPIMEDYSNSKKELDEMYQSVFFFKKRGLGNFYGW